MFDIGKNTTKSIYYGWWVTNSETWFNYGFANGYKSNELNNNNRERSKYFCSLEK